MSDLLALLTPLLVVDFINPVLLGLLVFAAASDRPVLNSTAMLLGHTATYFVCGVAIAHGLERISGFLIDYWNNPPTLAFVLSIIVGLYCFYWVFRPPVADRSADNPVWDLTPARCLAFGAAISVVGAPFALPYLAAIDQILKAKLDFLPSLTVLGIYNAAYAAPFLVVPGAVLVLGERAKPFLERVADRTVRVVDSIMPWLVGLLGVWLVFDGVYYFVVGEPVI